MFSKIVECLSVYVRNKAFKYLSHQYFAYIFQRFEETVLLGSSLLAVLTTQCWI